MREISKLNDENKKSIIVYNNNDIYDNNNIKNANEIIWTEFNKNAIIEIDNYKIRLKIVIISII